MNRKYASSILPGALAFAALIGWAIDSPWLPAIFVELPVMVPWTAVCILLLSLSLFALRRRGANGALPRAFAAIAFVAAVFSLVEYALRWKTGFDSFFFRSAVTRNPLVIYPGRMSPQTAFALANLALAQLLFGSARGGGRDVRLSFQFLNQAAMTLGLIALLGHLYGVVSLFGVSPWVGVSFPTAICVIALGAGALYLDADFGFVRALTQRNSAGVFFRRFVPGAIVFPFAFAALIRWSERHAFLNLNEGMALFVGLNIIFIVALAAMTARALEKAEAHRSQLELNRLLLTEANESGRLRDRFLANISHEVRTPLTAILGYIECLGDPSMPGDARREYLRQTRRNAELLLRTLDDVLILSKCEVGGLAVEPRRVRPAELVRAALARADREREQRGVEATVVTEIADETLVEIDGERVAQALVHLLSNAFKFTPAGEVRVETRLLRGANGRSARLRIDVVDSGIGVAEDAQPRLFQAFYQEDDSITRRFGGNGLGLALSRRIARALGGDLTLVESKPGSGSRFRLEMPCELAPRETASPAAVAAPARAAGEAALSGRQILLVDDNSDNQFLLSRYLKAAGAEVELANNGAEGLRAALERPHAAVLMDLQMPVMGGIEATRELRRRGYSGPILALSAHSLTEHRQKSLEAGCDAHLTKPIARAELIDGIVRAMSAADVGPSSATV